MEDADRIPVTMDGGSKMTRTSSWKLGLVAMVALGVPACDTGSNLPMGAPSLSLLAFEATDAGRGFTFLPPLVRHPSFSGDFEPGLSPVVQIDRLGLHGHPPTPVITFTTSGDGPDAIREGKEHYGVHWKTRHEDLTPSRIYRIRVLLSGEELGFADVEVLPSRRHVRNRHTRDVFPLVEGRTLPIRFRIEKTAPDATGKITRLSTGSPEDQQNMPAISGTQVVWTNAQASPTGSTNFDIYLYDLATGASLNLTNTPADQEFLEDIDGGNVVWTHTSPQIPGDIVLYETGAGRLSTIASSNSVVHFEQPSIRGRYVAFLRVAAQIDVMLYDILTGIPSRLTVDAAVQGRPRVGADAVVFEDYTNGNADIMGYRISTGTIFVIATGVDDQITPDVDGDTVVYVQTVAGHDQIFTYDLVTRSTTQRTTSASTKVLPRISGSRIVWSDDRGGNLDLYLYDLSTSKEEPLVTGAGDQFLSDIDADRVVYTDNSAGFEQVFLYTFPRR
jgi:beta propeller repeat protein